MKRREASEPEPKLITDAEAAEAIQWLEEFMQGDSSDAAQARVACGLIRGLERVLEKTGIVKDSDLEEAAHAAWMEYCTSGQKPDNVPANPDEVYKDTWVSWRDWLGWNAGAGNSPTGQRRTIDSAAVSALSGDSEARG